MKLSQIGVQLALAVLAVVLYEAILIEARLKTPPVPSREGLNFGGRLADLERRVAELARHGEPTPQPAPNADFELARVALIRAPDRWQPGGTDEDGHPAFDPRDLAWFSAMKSEVERIERQQRAADLICAELDHLGVDLSDWQREEVVRLTLGLRREVRDLLLWPASGGDAREKRTARLEEFRSAFEASLKEIVSSSDAVEIADRVGRYPGASSR